MMPRSLCVVFVAIGSSNNLYAVLISGLKLRWIVFETLNFRDDWTLQCAIESKSCCNIAES